MMNIARSKCVVCKKTEAIAGKKRTFYPFPREIDKCRAWIRAIGMENLVYMPLAELYKQLVCDEHFPPEYFSAEGLHIITIPTITQYPSLPDNIMALWPRSAMRVNPPQTRGLAVVNPIQEAEMNLLPDDFDNQLQSCLEQQLAGNSYTISAPQMTYSSSLKQDTILAAPEPMNYDSSKLPKVNIQFMNPVAPDKYETKEFQEVVNVEAPIQNKSEDHDVATNVNVFYGLATTISANKTVKMATKSNRTTIKSPKNKQSVIKISKLYQLLNNSQFDKSKIIHTYKLMKNSINSVPNTSNFEKFMTAKNTTMPKEPDPITDEDEESQSNTDGLTNTELIIDQNTQTEDSIIVTRPESLYAQIPTPVQYKKTGPEDNFRRTIY